MADDRFEADWLSLREPVDHRARPDILVGRVRRWWSGSGAERVLDLGAGTGSNLRYLAPRLPGHQKWTLVDHDAELLNRVEAPLAGISIATIHGDLDREGLDSIASADLVTASALLDLVSERWLHAAADACAQHGAAALFALSYDGTIEWKVDSRRQPEVTSAARREAARAAERGDAWVRDAVNAHQRRAKGMGSALGPDAAPIAERLFRAHGFQTTLAWSPWRLTGRDGALARSLLDGWAAAAREQRPEAAAEIEEWAETRRGTIDDGDFSLTVGHLELLALPE